jgi:hypothetical protein
MVPTWEHATAESQFPYGMRDAATTYASSASNDVAAYEDLPRPPPAGGPEPCRHHHDESYHGSASELPLATSHGYVEWDFSGVPDPVML